MSSKVPLIFLFFSHFVKQTFLFSYFLNPEFPLFLHGAPLRALRCMRESFATKYYARLANTCTFAKWLLFLTLLLDRRDILTKNEVHLN